MSAPEPQVREPRVHVSADLWTTGPARWTAWCPWCCRDVGEHRHTWAMAVEDALNHYCAGVQLASLKATLRTRISEWRRRGPQHGAWWHCADELERAIGGGRG